MILKMQFPHGKNLYRTDGGTRVRVVALRMVLFSLFGDFLDPQFI